MPFSRFVLWTHSFACGLSFRNGFPKPQQEKEYREIYDFTRYLLKTYNGSGKTFFLGHWEGDGLLRGTIRREDDVRATPTAIQGMIDWLNCRQRAIDDAKRDTPHKGVEVWHYTEVNHVQVAIEGRKAVANMVLPHVPVDFVSYSSYDTQEDPKRLKAALDFIQSKLTPKPGIAGRRVFIGEYGFPAWPLLAEQTGRNVAPCDPRRLAMGLPDGALLGILQQRGRSSGAATAVFG